MIIDRLTAAIATRREPAQQTEQAVQLVGGGLRQRMRRDSGEGVLSSAREGRAWVSRETVVLERASGRGRRARWGAVGEHRGARAEGEKARREVGGEAAVCVAEYESREGGPLKATFRVEAVQAGRYRLRWSLWGLGGRLEERSKGLRLRRGESRCVVDWSDVVESQGDIVALEATPEGGADIVFGPFELGAGEAVSLDPTIAEEIYSPKAARRGGARRLARTSDGILYAVYTKLESNWGVNVYVNDSGDWDTHETALTSAGASEENLDPAIAVDSRGNLHVVYQGSDEQIYYREYAGGTWATAVNISSGTGASTDQYRPTVVVDELDQPHVVWEGIASGGTETRIWWNTRVGGKWQGAQQLSTYSGMDSYDQTEASLAVDKDGNLHVVWAGRATGYTTVDQIWYAESVNEQWQAPVRISDYSGMSSYTQGEACVAVDGDGYVHVVWSGGATGYTSDDQIWYAERTSSWQTPVRISTASGMDTEDQENPTLAVDDDGHPQVLFEGWSTGDPEEARRVYHTWHNGTSWQTPSSKTTSGHGRAPNVRWSAFFTNGGNLDWLWYDGQTVMQPTGTTEESVTSVNRKAQSFKAPESRDLSYVQVVMNNGGDPVTATIEIRDDDSGEPGTLIASKTSEEIKSGTGWSAFFYFEDDEVALTADTTYWMVIYTSSEDLYWLVDTSGPYPDGVWAYSDDSGSSWNIVSGTDGNFRVYPFFDLCLEEDTSYQLADLAEVTLVEETIYEDQELREVLVDPLGEITTIEYDVFGNETIRTDALGGVTTSLYDEEEQLTATVDALANRTSYSYDVGGRQTGVEDANNHLTTYYWDMAGRQTAVEDPLEYCTSYQYDAIDRRTAVVNALGYTTTYEYQKGQLEAQVDALGNRTTYSYDPVGNRTAVQDANGNITTSQYDPIYRRTVGIDPLENRTTYSYDENGRLEATENPLEEITTNVYDENGQRIAVVDPLGNRTSSVYDFAGRLEATVDALENRTSFVYDQAGRQVATIDPLGNRTTSVYDSLGRVEASIDAVSSRTSFVYDALGRQVATIDPLENRSTSVYDELGRLTASVNPLLETTTYDYDAAGRQVAVEDPLENRSTSVYDELGRLTASVNPLLETTSYDYDEAGRQVATIDPLGNRSTSVYDGAGRVTASVNALTLTTSYDYDAAGRQVATIDPLGNRTTSVYDAAGQLSASVNPLLETTSYDYDAAGRQVSVANPLGERTTSVYDAASRLAAAVDGRENRTSFVYDAAGRPVVVEDPLENRTTSVYDEAGRVTESVNALTQTTSYDYDAAGRQVAVEDPLGNRTTSVYDEAGRLSASVNPLLETTSYDYDEAGRLVGVQDPLGYWTTTVYDEASQPVAVVDGRENRATVVYDSLGRVEVRVDALEQATSFGYDEVGQPEWRLDAKDQRTTYVYDAAGRRERVEHSDESRVTYSYDEAGRRTLMEDGTGMTTSSYDGAGRLEKVAVSGGTITYSYDEAGNRETMEDPSGVTSYSYDAANRLHWLENPLNERTTYGYDALGRPTTMVYANEVYAESQYDAAGRTEAVRNRKSDDSVLSIFSYSYDEAGSRTGVEEANGDRVTWSYDDAGQLARERRSGGNAYDLTYTYDEVGNRLTKEDGGATTTYSYDVANQLETEETTSKLVTYSYDAKGNVEVVNDDEALTTYAWDLEDRMVGAELPDATLNTMSYDGDGKRREMEDSDGSHDLVWDGENILLDLDTSSTRAAYTHAPMGFGELVSQRRSAASAFHHYDGLGSTDRLTDSSENTSISYLYKAFGEQSVLSGSHDNPFGWVGRLGYYRQGDLDNYWLRARTYSHASGRFLSRDPMPNGNLYLYPGNSPVVLVDPSGMQGCTAPGCGGAPRTRHTRPRGRGSRGRYLRPSTTTTGTVAAAAGGMGPGGGGGGGFAGGGFAGGGFAGGGGGGFAGGGGGGGGGFAGGGGGGGGGGGDVIAIGGPPAQFFPIYQCENQAGFCCELPWGYGPPRTYVFPDYTAEKNVWHTDIDCNCRWVPVECPPQRRGPGECGRVEGSCSGVAHRQTLKIEDGEVVHASPELHRPMEGECVKPREGQICAEPGDEGVVVDGEPEEDGPEEEERTVAFWLGGVGENPEDPNDPNRVYLRRHISRAIDVLTARGYNAVFVGGKKEDLREANIMPYLSGLWAGAHGGCLAQYQVCYLRTLGEWESAPGPSEGAYRVSPLSQYNDWLQVDRTSLPFFRLMACHCLGIGVDSVPVAVVRGWYDQALGIPSGRTSFCRVNPDGKVDDPSAYVLSISVFMSFFPVWRALV
jgi:RHS repeat-associated protein